MEKRPQHENFILLCVFSLPWKKWHIFGIHIGHMGNIAFAHAKYIAKYILYHLLYVYRYIHVGKYMLHIFAYAKYMSNHLSYEHIYFAITRKTAYMWLRYMYCETSEVHDIYGRTLLIYAAYTRFADQSEHSCT